MSEKELEEKAREYLDLQGYTIDEFHQGLQNFIAGYRLAQADMLAESAKGFEEWVEKNGAFKKVKVFTVDLHLGNPQQYETVPDDDMNYYLRKAYQAASLAKDAQYKAEIEAKDKRIAELEACVLDLIEGIESLMSANYSGRHQDLIKSINQRGEK